MAVLVSHVAEYTAPNALSYAIVILDVGTTQNSVTVAGLRHLAYQAVSLSSPLDMRAVADLVLASIPIPALSQLPSSHFPEATPRS